LPFGVQEALLMLHVRREGRDGRIALGDQDFVHHAAVRPQLGG
jgi:hypothetical protein